MKLNHHIADTRKLVPLTVFVVYDCADTARRLKQTLDRANVEFDELFDFDLRLWRLDILELPECWSTALQDLEEADLLTMVFSSHGNSLFSPELNYMVDKWKKKENEPNRSLFSNRLTTDCREVSTETLRVLARRSARTDPAQIKKASTLNPELPM